jgi:hypothetical protein
VDDGLVDDGGSVPGEGEASVVYVNLGLIPTVVEDPIVDSGMVVGSTLSVGWYGESDGEAPVLAVPC